MKNSLPADGATFDPGETGINLPDQSSIDDPVSLFLRSSFTKICHATSTLPADLDHLAILK
jgi:hypothetical protein